MFANAAAASIARKRNMRDRYAQLPQHVRVREVMLLQQGRKRSPASPYQAERDSRAKVMIWSNPSPDPHNKIPHLRPVNIKEAILDRRDTPAPKAKDNRPEITRPAPQDHKPAPRGKGGKGAKSAATDLLFDPPPKPGQFGPGRPTAGNMSIGGRKKPEPD